MLKKIRRSIRKMFREFLVYHHSSLEYRAKILTLMVSADGNISKCEYLKLQEIAHKVYSKDTERAEILVETVQEYHTKIITNNGLDFEHMIQLVEQETKEVKRFANKIDIALLRELVECIKNEEDIIFQERILEFLQTLKDEYGDK